MSDRPRIVPVRHGVDLVVHGGADRDALARRVLDELDAVAGRGLRVLREFLAATFDPGRGEFGLSAVEVAAGPAEEDHVEVILRFGWLDRDDPAEWGDTYFDVGYLAPHPRRADDFRPVRFTIGFW